MATKGTKGTKCCGVHRLWETIGGIRLYRTVDGKRVYRAICSKCRLPADVEGECGHG